MNESRSEKTKLRQIELLECPLCYEQVDECDGCRDLSQTITEGWWCYNDGHKHYCQRCWQKQGEELHKEKVRKNYSIWFK